MSWSKWGVRINSGRVMVTEQPDASLLPEYFDAIYDAHDDPWEFETSAYEAAKYDATLAALPVSRYRAAFEIGCSIGVLTERLAARCDALLAVDVSERALHRARVRCANLPQVRLAQMRVPQEYPEQSFDLTLVSEVGYYWSMADLIAAQRAIVAHLLPGGHLLLVHWTPHVADYPLTGDAVHEAFIARAKPELQLLTGERGERYRLDLFVRR